MISSGSEVDRILRDGGCRGWVHARPVDDPTREVGLDPDEVVPIASLYKAPLAAVWAHRADGGHLDPLRPLTLQPAERTPGPTGLSLLQDPVTMSPRDLVRLMLTLSDNAAADHVLDLVGGAETVTAELAVAGIPIAIRHGTRTTIRRVVRDTGSVDDTSYMRGLADIHHDVRTSEYDPALASAAAPRALTDFLARLWTRRLAPGPCGDLVRDAMTQQIWRHRIASGFPHDDVVVAGKTGTLGVLRHEMAVVAFPDEVPIAVAVLTHSARPELHLPVVDAAIGAAAAAAVHPLRASRRWTPEQPPRS